MGTQLGGEVPAERLHPYAYIRHARDIAAFSLLPRGKANRKVPSELEKTLISAAEVTYFLLAWHKYIVAALEVRFALGESQAL
jgi:hypothetical protein